VTGREVWSAVHTAAVRHGSPGHPRKPEIVSYDKNGSYARTVTVLDDEHRSALRSVAVSEGMSAVRQRTRHPGPTEAGHRSPSVTAKGRQP
jgi:hypothetical protein